MTTAEYYIDAISPEKQQRSRKLTSIAVILGNTIVWADFALYGYFSPVLSHVFFPFTTVAKAYILYFIVFALSFVFRPIGSVMAGAYADKNGRKRTLIGIVLISTTLTTLIGLLPSFATAGYLSPILLTVLRILQTMSIAGEPTNSGSLLIEQAKPHRKGLVTSYVMAGIFLGFFVGILSFLALSYFLGEAQIAAWGWRLTYLIFLPTGLAAVVLLQFVEESPVYLQNAKQKHLSHHPLRDAVYKYPKQLFLAFGLSIMMAVGNYFLLGSLPDYLVSVIHLPLLDANLAITVGLFVSVIFIPLMGYLSDKIGRKKVAVFGALGFIITLMPVLWLILKGKMLFVVAGLVIYCFFLAPIAAVLPAMLAEMFPFAVRCTAGALGYNLALLLVGGTTPVIIQIMLDEKTVSLSHSAIYHPFYYVLAIGVIHLIFLCYTRETKDVDVSV